jgi:hypothetical protein
MPATWLRESWEVFVNVQRFDENTRETVLEEVLKALDKAQRDAKVRLVLEGEVRRVLEKFVSSPGKLLGYRFHGGNVPQRYRYAARTTKGEVFGWYPGLLAYRFERGYARRTRYGDTSSGEEGWMRPLDAARALRPHIREEDLARRYAELISVYGALPEGVFAVVELAPPSSLRFTRPVLLAISPEEEYLVLGPGLAVRVPRWDSWKGWAEDLKREGIWDPVRDWGRGRLTPEEAYVALGLLDPTFLG